jgi:competence protein ComEA
MRKFIVVLGMVFALNVVCTGCGSSRVSFVTSDENAATGETPDDENETVEAEPVEKIDSDNSDTEQDEAECSSSSGEEDAGSPDRLAVYVCGAVNVPGVYYFEAGDIKSLALEKAGGFADGASTDYVNLAEKLQDGEKLYFPYEEEVEAGDIRYSSISDTVLTSAEEAESRETTVQSSSSGKVNINTADRTELMTLPGIGESKAELIISYRESNGSFSSIEDIMNINGIKNGVYSKIKDYITVD